MKLSNIQQSLYDGNAWQLLCMSKGPITWILTLGLENIAKDPISEIHGMIFVSYPSLHLS